MGGFSKVTHFLRDTLLTGDRVSPSTDMMTSSQRLSVADTTSVSTANTSLAVNSLSEAGFELITAVSHSLSVCLSVCLSLSLSLSLCICLSVCRWARGRWKHLIKFIWYRINTGEGLRPVDFRSRMPRLRLSQFVQLLHACYHSQSPC